MSLMPSDPNAELNPYAPPQAALDEHPAVLEPADLAEAEATRRKYINHEASIKSLGALHLLGAFFVALGFVVAIMGLLSGSNNPPTNTKAGVMMATNPSAIMIAVLLYFLFAFGINLALGLGLRRLKGWARWTDVVLITLSLLGNVVSVLISGGTGENAGFTIGVVLISSLIPAYILYLLLSEKAAVVFSPGYKEIIARTPHIKYQTGWLVKGCLMVFVAIIVLAVVLALVGVFLGTRS